MARRTYSPKKQIQPKKGHEFLQDHPLFKIFDMTYPLPLLVKEDDGLVLLPSAVNYYLLEKCKSSEYREKIINTLPFNAVTFWGTEKGLTKLGKSVSKTWETRKSARFLAALKLKASQHPIFVKLLLKWNPKTVLLQDKYAKEGEPDLVKSLVLLRKAVKKKDSD